MLKSIRLRNFRCFDDHTVPLRPTTLLVGRNNAGKSTVVEALHLLSIFCSKLAGVRSVPAPPWTGLGRYTSCHTVSIRDSGINLETIFHRYGDPPAILTAQFDKGTQVDVYIGREKAAYGVVTLREEQVTTRSDILKLGLEPISILPQVGPLQLHERVLTEQHVLKSQYTRLAPQHFRNQIRQFRGHFENFAELAESSWPGLRVHQPTLEQGNEHTELALNIRDRDFHAEVGLMGHGVQMWLQMIWFLARTPDESTVILDEPDVYLHPDLQRKLFRLVHKQDRQTIVATHSVEIMSEADPADIMIIDRSRKRSKFASSSPAVQKIIDHVGGVHNIHLARLSSAKKLLLVEGKDKDFLGLWHGKLFPDSAQPLSQVPSLPVGGWGGWQRAVGSSMLLRNAMGETVKVYCLFDSDYHLEQDIEHRFSEATARGIYFHVWIHKEIENYFLVPNVIARVLKSRAGSKKKAPSGEEIYEQILQISDDMHSETVLNFGQSLLESDRGLGMKKAHSLAESWIAERWKDEDRRVGLVSGKQLFSRLSEWTQERFKLSFGPMAVARAMRVGEIPPEAAKLVSKIEHGQEPVRVVSDRFSRANRATA